MEQRSCDREICLEGLTLRDVIIAQKSWQLLFQLASSSAARSLNVMSTHCEIAIKNLINKRLKNAFLTSLNGRGDIQLIKILRSIRKHSWYGTRIICSGKKKEKSRPSCRGVSGWGHTYTLPHSERVHLCWRGKGPWSSSGGFKVAEKFTAAAVGKAWLELSQSGWGRRERKGWRKQRRRSSEAPDCNAFQVETRSDN